MIQQTELAVTVESPIMNPNTRSLHTLGQSLWIDGISRRPLRSGALARYIGELSVSGLSLNPTLFGKTIETDDCYDASIQELAAEGFSAEEILVHLALDDLTEAAALFRPIHLASHGRDGWVSFDMSPLLANDTDSSIKFARQLHVRATCPNLMIRIPGTPAGLPAIEQSIADGIPVNITLLFSREQYLAAADAYLCGLERRVAAGLDPGVTCVASMSISPWDAAVVDNVAETFRNRLGIAIAMRTYKAYRDLLDTRRWQQLEAAGGRPQRLLWAETAPTDLDTSDVLYIEALAAPETIASFSEKTLFAFADHGKFAGALPAGGDYAEAVIAEFIREGIADESLSVVLQNQAVAASAERWHALIYHIAAKSQVLRCA